MSGVTGTTTDASPAPAVRAIDAPEGVPDGANDAVPSDPVAEAARAVQHILADMHDMSASSPASGRRGLVVDSPPGAGKTTLVVRAASALVEGDERCMIVAQTNNQVDDLIERLAATRPDLRLGRLSASGYRPPDRLSALRNLTVATGVDDVRDADVVLGTAAKWVTVREHRWSWAIVDEAYQMRSDTLLLIAGRFDRALFVGDPGQLDPFSNVETSRWTGLPYDPMQSAVAVVLTQNPDLGPPHRLPVSWRLPPSAAPIVSAAFYPYTGFSAATADGTRRLRFAAAGLGGAVDETLTMAARTGWALHELPARHTVRTDAEAAGAAAAIAARLLSRHAVAHCERFPDGRPMGPDRIAVGVAHRDQAEQVRRALREAPEPGAAEITVDTANRLQGREFDVTVVVHPLSGRRDATAFHLEAGRLCVLTSRHRHACIVVARAGIADLLDAHPSTEPVNLNVPLKFPDGWEANQAVLAHLADHRVPALR